MTPIPPRSWRKGGKTGTHQYINARKPTAPFNSVPLFVFRDPNLHDLLQQRSRQRLIHREANGPPGCREVFKFLLELLDYTGARREQAAMVLERRVTDQHSLVLERRNPVADNLGGLGRHHGLNDRTGPFQSAASRLGHTREIFVHVLRSNFASHRRTATS